MSAIDASRIIKVQCSMDLDGNRLSVGMNYAASASLTNTDCEHLVDAWETTVMPVMQAAISEDVNLQMIYANCIKANTVRPWMDGLSGQKGSLTGFANPSNVAAVLQLRQHEITGKSNGRIFLPGIRQSDVVDSLITSAFASSELTLLGAAMMTTLTNGSGTNFNLCIVRRRNAEAPITPVGYLVSEVVPTRSMGTQRRRTTELRSFSV